ncbi:hypothetical protein AcW1_009360 [Taiwanofungus camphoratus]|nr:hypothetical protein AcW1_009360 [Antrodia cinnamomea]
MTETMEPTARSGRYSCKKALLIGINYCDATGYNVEASSKSMESLRGPRQDALDFAAFLIDKFGYDSADVTVMVEDHENPDLVPSHINVRRALRYFHKSITAAKTGDRFVFLYAGHSAQVECKEHTEEDGLDEVLVTTDLEHIKDNELRQYLVDDLPAGAYLTAILDSCHSGTLLDLIHYRCNDLASARVFNAMQYKNMDSNAAEHKTTSNTDTSSPILRLYQRHASTSPAERTTKARASLDFLTSAMNLTSSPSRMAVHGSVRTASLKEGVFMDDSVGSPGQLRRFERRRTVPVPSRHSIATMPVVLHTKNSSTTVHCSMDHSWTARSQKDPSAGSAQRVSKPPSVAAQTRSITINIDTSFKAQLRRAYHIPNPIQHALISSPATALTVHSFDSGVSSVGNSETISRRNTFRTASQSCLTHPSIGATRPLLPKLSTGSFMEDESSLLELLTQPRVCMSPMSRECDGSCLWSPTEKPHVLSFAQCNDSCRAWEDPSGRSMTQMLIDILDTNPQPSIRVVYTTMRKLLYRATLRRIREMFTEGVDIPDDVWVFEGPLLGSQETLDMNAAFVL